jgi:hypothetical protein
MLASNKNSTELNSLFMENPQGMLRLITFPLCAIGPKAQADPGSATRGSQ